MPPTTPYLAREDLIAHLLRAVPAGSSVRADTVIGALGMGKSTLLCEVEQRGAGAVPGVSITRLDLALYDPGAGARGGVEETYGQALNNYDQLFQLATDIVSSVNKAWLARIREVGDVANLDLKSIKSADLNVYQEISAGSAATVSAAPQSLTVNVERSAALDAEFVCSIHKAKAQLSETLVACLNEASGSHAVLVLMDNAHTVAAKELGLWISCVIRQLNGAVVVLANEPDAELELPEGLGERLRIPPFTRDEVVRFLAQKLEWAPVPDVVVDLLLEWSGGIPVALEILVDLMNDPDIHLGRAELENRLARLPKSAEGRLAGVVTEMIERLEGRDLAKALRAASIPFECDIELFSALLADEGVTPQQATVLMKTLEVFSFTEEYRSPIDGGEYMRVHPFIRSGIADHMARYEPRELERLHAVAADFFYCQLTGSDSYGEMFGYEQPTQQLRRRKWMYHLARSGDRRNAILQAARLFLDSFWWWGNYVYFDFCEKLADDFETLALESGDPEFAAFAAAVRVFLDNYPYRAKLRQDFERNYPPAHWEEVEGALLEMRDLCGLVDTVPGPSVAENQVSGLIEVFLAHCYRYATPPDRAEVLKCYDRARRFFTDSQRGWDIPWIIFERGDFGGEAGDYALALTDAESAASLLYEHLHDKNPDEELIANIHRLRGDCAWFGGDLARSAREYGLAVLHSYLFHRIGGPPDDYTMQFYFELRGRAIARMLELWRSDRTEEAVTFGQALQEQFPVMGSLPRRSDSEWRAICESGTVSELALALFPRGPEIAELGQRKATPFMLELLRVERQVHERARYDLTQNGDGPRAAVRWSLQVRGCR